MCYVNVIAAMPPPPPHGSYVSHFPNPKTNANNVSGAGSVGSAAAATPRRSNVPSVAVAAPLTPLHSSSIANIHDKNTNNMPVSQR